MKADHRRRSLRLEYLENRKLLHAAPLDLPGGEGEGEGERVADFALLDTNPNSATGGELVSPRDFLGQVSGWYFGHAT